MLVHQLLEQAAARTPDARAIVHGARSWSYGELNRLANRFAALLAAARVRRGDRVLIAMENSGEMVGAYLGALKAGGVAVPLAAGPRSDRLQRAVADCGPAASIVERATLADPQTKRTLRASGPVYVAGRPGPAEEGIENLTDALESCSDDFETLRSIDRDLASIIYTSGSTGEPRGVMLTHRNLVTNARSIVAYLGLTSRDRVMCVLPFHYVYGLSLLHTHLLAGGTVVIDNRFTFPNVVLEAMKEHEVTGFAGVPSTFALLLHRSNLDVIELPSLRYVTQAGGPMPAARIRQWLTRGPKVPLFVMYGATEAGARLTYLDPSALHEKIGSIGRPIPNVEVLVVHEDGRLAATGEVGELVARGANIAPGYWRNADETRERFTALGYRTGDLGYRDDEGYLFVVGRRGDMLKVGAHRVGAREIEDVLVEFPGVMEAAVVGVEHDLLGEVPVACVSFQAGHQPDLEALGHFCHTRLAQHKVPARFVLLDDLPKLPGVGKINKRLLKDVVARTTGRAV